jgi:hypothetical protein
MNIKWMESNDVGEYYWHYSPINHPNDAVVINRLKTPIEIYFSKHIKKNEDLRPSNLSIDLTNIFINKKQHHRLITYIFSNY